LTITTLLAIIVLCECNFLAGFCCRWWITRHWKKTTPCCAENWIAWKRPYEKYYVLSSVHFSTSWTVYCLLCFTRSCRNIWYSTKRGHL